MKLCCNSVEEMDDRALASSKKNPAFGGEREEASGSVRIQFGGNHRESILLLTRPHSKPAQMSLTLLNARSEVGQFRSRDQGATCIPGQCLFFPSLINVRRYYSLLLPEFSLTVRVMIRSSNQHTVVQEVSRHQLDEQKKGNSVLFA